MKILFLSSTCFFLFSSSSPTTRLTQVHISVGFSSFTLDGGAHECVSVGGMVGRKGWGRRNSHIIYLSLFVQVQFTTTIQRSVSSGWDTNEEELFLRFFLFLLAERDIFVVLEDILNAQWVDNKFSTNNQPSIVFSLWISIHLLIVPDRPFKFTSWTLTILESDPNSNIQFNRTTEPCTLEIKSQNSVSPLQMCVFISSLLNHLKN